MDKLMLSIDFTEKLVEKVIASRLGDFGIQSITQVPM